MLRITIPAEEFWDEVNEEFIYTKEQTLQLEHSLVSLSKWESKWCKAFLGKQDKTEEEILDYVKCMTLTQNVNPEVYKRLTAANYDAINAYIEAPMTATFFPVFTTGLGSVISWDSSPRGPIRTGKSSFPRVQACIQRLGQTVPQTQPGNGV